MKNKKSELDQMYDDLRERLHPLEKEIFDIIRPTKVIFSIDKREDLTIKLAEFMNQKMNELEEKIREEYQQRNLDKD